MSWNYRIIKYPDGKGFGLHEIYYNEDGTYSNMTQDPIRFTCDEDEGQEGIIKSLEMALNDAKNHSPLEIERGKV